MRKLIKKQQINNYLLKNQMAGLHKQLEVERQRTKFAHDSKAHEVVLIKLSLEKIEKDMKHMVDSL